MEIGVNGPAVLIADEHFLIRLGIKYLLKRRLLAPAQGIETEIPQRRLFAARGIGEKSPTPRFSRGDAP